MSESTTVPVPKPVTRRQQLVDGLLRWVAPLVILGTAALFVYAAGTQERPQRKKPPVRKSIPVEIVKPARHSGTLDLVISGVAVPFREVELAVRVGGEVTFKTDNLCPGGVIDEGDELLRIDPVDYELEVARLEQEVAKTDLDLEWLTLEQANAERLLKISRTAVMLRQQEFERAERAHAAKSISRSESDPARLNYLTALETLTAQENIVRTFETQSKQLNATAALVGLQLRRAKLDLKRTVIRAPFPGVVIATHIEQSNTVAGGTIVATLEDTSRVEVRTSLRSEDLGFVQGQSYALPAIPATIEHTRAGRTHRWDAVLSRQDGLGIDPKTRTMPVRLLVPRPTENVSVSESEGGEPLTLLRGMFVRVRLHVEPTRPLLVLPEAVIRPGKTVWVARDGALEIEPVRIARIEEGRAYCDGSGGLAPDAGVISSPVPNARAGLPVSAATSKPPRAGKRRGVPQNPDQSPGKKS